MMGFLIGLLTLLLTAVNMPAERSLVAELSDATDPAPLIEDAEPLAEAEVASVDTLDESTPIPDDTLVPDDAPIQPTTPEPSAVHESGYKVVHHPFAVYQPYNEPHILTWWEYVHTYEGLCPHEQPDNVQGSEFKKTWQWLAAIGATSVDRSPEQVLEQYWSYWHEGTISGVINHHFNDGSRLLVDWDTLTAPDSQFHTDLIRGFEERYTTHCPND